MGRICFEMLFSSLCSFLVKVRKVWMEIFGHVYQCFRKELWQIVFNNISCCFFTRRVAHLFKMNIEKCGPIKWYIVLGSNSVTNDIMNLFGAGCCGTVSILRLA